jgi:hypothetical protein
MSVVESRREFELWELHSELVLVCPELRTRSRELLPERDPHAFLTERPRLTLVPPEGASERRPDARLPAVALLYALSQMARVLSTGLAAIGLVVGLALLLDVLVH